MWLLTDKASSILLRIHARIFSMSHPVGMFLNDSLALFRISLSPVIVLLVRTAAAVYIPSVRAATINRKVIDWLDLFAARASLAYDRYAARNSVPMMCQQRVLVADRRCRYSMLLSGHLIPLKSDVLGSVRATALAPCFSIFPLTNIRHKECFEGWT